MMYIPMKVKFWHSLCCLSVCWPMC